MSDFKPVLIILLLLTSTTTSRRIALIKRKKHNETKVNARFVEREIGLSTYSDKICGSLPFFSVSPPPVLEDHEFYSFHTGVQTEADKFTSEILQIAKRATRMTLCAVQQNRPLA